MKYIIAVLALCSFLFTWEKAFGEIITTDNLLSNSTFTGSMDYPRYFLFRRARRRRCGDPVWEI